MKTVYTIDPAGAAAFIKRGGVVAFPTETVYGLGANVFDEEAVEKIFEAKRRPGDNPLIVHISRIEEIDELAAEVTAGAKRLTDAFFPGPLTIVVPKVDRVPSIATAGLDTVGVRMPNLEITRRFLSECALPVAAPSANLSGRPSPTTWQAVAEDLDGRIDCILQGDPTEIGLESTVVDCTADVPVVLRIGSISIEELRRVVPETIASASDDLTGRSPGTRHQHYKPSARVVIVEHPQGLENAAGEAYIGLARSSLPFDHQLILADAAGYAHSLFEFMRECDRRGIRTIYCQEIAETGIGAALMDRLRRAAA